MNRYDLFRLVRELGQLVESAHDKTAEEVARELIACGQRKLAEAQAKDGLNQPPNGTAIPSLAVEIVAPAGSESATHSVVAPVPTDAAQA